MTLPEYKHFADGLAKTMNVEDGIHGYFLQHHPRLWQTASRFNLWNLHHKHVLEIGPFYSYTPFILWEQGNEVQVVEGDDPAVYPLRPLYEARGIPFTTCDLFESFGMPATEKHRLPFPDNQFDVISCWETMEHFNFNPVGFVRDLHRILKPGGEAFITVPNLARFENRIRLLLGRSTGQNIDDYNYFYQHAGGRFMGFHWREYTLNELAHLFVAQNFSVISSSHLLSFQHHPQLTPQKKLKRLAGKIAFSLSPSVGNLCAIAVKKTI